MRWEFARRFVEGIGKLARNTLEDRRRKTMRLTAGDSEGCRNAGVRRSVVDAGVPQEGGLGSVQHIGLRVIEFGEEESKGSAASD
ncbi:hypothetical protein BHE74_00056666 [Ensete ventricosum]|nr:hypothetical protein BHE74_00056666 [Ensete ventricosum]